jgi:hypothetical protein
MQGALRSLNASSPYSFGVFVPWNGAYGRHNREYTPLEVESLARYAGFDTISLETADVYGRADVPEELIRYMKEHDHPLELRGHNIFYLGRKNAADLPALWPASLYPADPSIFSGALELRRAEKSIDGFIVRIENVSPSRWLARGPDRIRLTVDRVDQNGLVSRDAHSFDLPNDVEPGEATEVAIRAIKGAGVGGCWHEIGLYAEGRGPFIGVGRTGIVSVFAESLEPSLDPRGCGDAA